MSTDSAASGLTETDEFDRRDQILEAANQCFTQLGIHRTSVQDVARMANVSRGTVYRYFEDRNVLIDAAIEFGAQKFYRLVADAMAEKTTLAEKLGAMAETHAAILLDLHPVRARTPVIAARLHLSGKADRPALQQQVFGQRGLARVGMGDDRESPAVSDLRFHLAPLPGGGFGRAHF